MAAKQPGRYKSEVFVPIQKDPHSFEEKQKSIWDDMHERMEKRRKEWETDVERMREDFFRLKPTDTRKGSSENLLESMKLDNIFHDDHHLEGNKKFRVSFDVKEFTPEEINVRTQEQKLFVHARHEEKGTGRNVSREFSRTIDIPKHVDPNDLQCTMTSDGVLQIEAPVAAPEYEKIKHIAQSSYAPPPQHSPQAVPSPGRTQQYGPTITEQDGSRKLKLIVEIGDEFGPEDISVKTVDKKLVIFARHEEKSAGRSSFREFNREFDLPEDVDPNTVVASLSGDGKLIVEAPLSSYSRGAYYGKPGSSKQPSVTISFSGQ